MRLLRLEELCSRTNRLVQSLHYVLNEGLASTESSLQRSPLPKRAPEEVIADHQRAEAEKAKAKDEADHGGEAKPTSERRHPKMAIRAFSESTADIIKELTRPQDLDLHSQATADSALYRNVLSEEDEDRHIHKHIPEKEPVFRFTESQATPENSKNGDTFDRKEGTPVESTLNPNRKSLELDKRALLQGGSTFEASIQTSPMSRPRSPKSPRKYKLSTFEKYASMVNPVAPAPNKEEKETKPIKRQVGIPSSASLYNITNGTKFPASPDSGEKNHLSRLGLGMRSRDSESNLSTYSASSFYSNPMPKTMPYASAPAYSSITDHIDTSMVDKNWLQELNTSNSAGFLPIVDHTNHLDLELDAIPLSPSASLQVDLNQYTRKMSQMSPMSEVSDGCGRLRQAEQTDYDVMESVIDGGVYENAIDVSPEHSSGGIEFTVRRRSDPVASKSKSKETEF